jgi:hypothetical protein
MAKAVHHPSLHLFQLTFLLLALTVLFGFISVFVPWVMKDIGIGQRAWAYPFKTCIEETFSLVNKETCMDNDFIEPTGVPLTGGHATCKAFILATIAFVFISVILGVVTLVVLAYVIYSLWSRPVAFAGLAQVCLIVVCVAANLSWIMFICYAEKTCAPNSIFPVQGYSYGFILYIFASAFAIGSVVTGFMALKRLKAYQEIDELAKDEDSSNEVTVVEYPSLPVPTMSFNNGNELAYPTNYV